MENTKEAFEFAGKSNCWGIETDVHRTKDGKFVVFHDDSTLRLCEIEHIIEDTNYADLIKVLIKDSKNNLYTIPTLEDYVEICKKHNKVAIIEFKNSFKKEDIFKIIDIIIGYDYLKNAVFISFDLNNLLILKSKYPNQPAQFLTLSYSQDMVELLQKNKIDLDIEFTCLSQDRINYCHSKNIKVNCWTLNEASIAELFQKYNIDYITSNILGQKKQKNLKPAVNDGNRKSAYPIIFLSINLKRILYLYTL